jgi:cytochrome o ubiquinol oxidase operon protein cyoD
MYNTLTSRVIGFVASLVFTLTAFFLVARPNLFHLEMDALILMILILAVLQGMAQAIFFLHVLSEKGTRWNLFVFASTISIIVVIVVFSIWIMNHLNYNMMPH